jgi:hypothetical protein
MKVFLSWSGTRSKRVADSLGKWLPRVIQAVEPWVSSEMDKGSRWPEQIASHLEEAKVGIICVTRDNADAPWLLFEAGALSKTKDAYVCTFLLNLSPSDVEWPLAQFQHTQVSKDDVKKLVETVNRIVEKVGEHALAAATLDDTYEMWWARLEQELKEIAESEESPTPMRKEREILEELLQLVRSIASSSNTIPIVGMGGVASLYSAASGTAGAGLADSDLPLQKKRFAKELAGLNVRAKRIADLEASTETLERQSKSNDPCERGKE